MELGLETPDQTFNSGESELTELELNSNTGAEIVIPLGISIVGSTIRMSTTPSATLNGEVFVYGDTTTVGTRWEMWLERFNMYLTATGLTDAAKVKACFLYQIGAEAHAIFKTLRKADNSDTYAEASTKLTNHLISKRSQFSEDQIFRRSSKRSDESVDEFVMRLRQLATHCKYADIDKEILAHFVAHCNMEAFQLKAVREDALTLDTALTLARGYERDAGSLLQLKSKNNQSGINYINQRDNSNSNNGNRRQSDQNQHKCRNCGNNSHQNQQQCPAVNKLCLRCGKKNHFAAVCRSQGFSGSQQTLTTQRHNYQNDRYNNYQQVQRTHQPQQQSYQQQRHSEYRQQPQRQNNNSGRPQQQQNTRTSQYNHNYNTQANIQEQQIAAINDPNNINENVRNSTYVQEHVPDDRNRFDYSAYQLSISNGDQEVPKVDVLVCGTTIRMVIDTGAVVNMINIETYNNLAEKPPLESCNRKFYAYGEIQAIGIVGQFLTEVSYKEKKCLAAFLVATKGQLNLLSYSTSVRLGLVKIIRHVNGKSSQQEELGMFKQKYPQVFSGKLGKLKGQSIKLDIDETIRPIKQKLRRLPEKLKSLVEQELLDMEKQGIIERVSWPTDWISNIVAVPKSQLPLKIRITCDMRPLNKAIIRTRYATTTVEDVISHANSAKFFSKIDLNKAYHQIEIDEASRDLTTITTHIGLFRYVRLTMGISLAAEIFSEKIRCVIAGCRGASNISDDILVYGRTQEEHDENLNFVLQQLNENGLTVNQDKCNFNQSTIIFFGLELSADGIKPTHDKLKALREAKIPTNAAELTSYLGLAVFCGRFIQDFASITDVLWVLARSKIWKWDQVHEQAFNQFKQAVTNMAMGYFNIDWKTQLWVDASPVGLGAVLVQVNPKDYTKRHIVSFASRLLSQVERRYSQCEKEGLAMVWGCEKFYLQLFGHSFIIKNDNTAMEIIFNNPRSNPPARIERWLLRLSQFDYQVEHTPGKFNIADFFSRHPVEIAPIENIAVKFVNMIMNYAIPNAVTLDQISKATLGDTQLQLLAKFIIGNERTLPRLPHILREYKNIFNELAVTSEGIILRGNQIVKPSSLQQYIMALAHIGHQGIVKTKALLRSKVWFAGITNKIEHMIHQCHECQLNQGKPQFEPLQPSPFPIGPWLELSGDFFGPMKDGSHWLVITDDYSRYPVVKEVSTTSADVNIPIIEELFTMMGIPDVLRTDNGAPFQSHKFNEFAKRLGFKHRRITPYWPRANGEAERFMRNLNKVIRNAVINGRSKQQELQLFLRAYRATPHCVTKIAPNDLLFGFNRTSGLPSSKTIQRDTNLHEIARENDFKAKEQMKKYYDNHKHVSECPIGVGTKVYLKLEKVNKDTPLYDPNMYEVIDMNRSMITRYGRTSKPPGQINIVLVEQNKQGGKCSVWNKTDNEKYIIM